MTMTKSDFIQRAEAELGNYPTIAQRYRVGDPHVVAMLNAFASMLAAASQDAAMHAAEPFVKATDATILADAAVKGILPFARSAKVSITVANAGASPFNLATGRRLMDAQGRLYSVDAGTTIGASSSAVVTATQYAERTVQHTVTVYQPFYPIEVPAAQNGAYIEGVRVFNGVNAEMTYNPDFTNVGFGDLIYHLETDVDRRLMVRFGAVDVAGYQPAAGEQITILIRDCEGEVTLPAGSAFAFEYTLSPADGQITLTLDEVEDSGRAPLPVSVIREMSKFPSIYNTSAVYLGNFDFLVRRTIGGFRFLSIWNEQIEEDARGPDIDNINTLFVAAMKDGVDGTTLFNEVQAVILAADDSYKVQSVAVVETTIAVDITARVPGVYDFAQVEQQIEEIILGRWGRDSEFAKAGLNKVLYKDIYKALTDGVAALQGAQSDLEVEVTDSPEILPEEYRYIDSTSLTITVEQTA